MKALITGILGQDGVWLARLLKEKGYEVHGLARRVSSTHPRMHLLPDGVVLHEANVTDLSSVLRVQQTVQPDELFHLAAESHVGRSFKEPGQALTVIATGTLNVLEAVRISGIWSRVYVASTSEMFGGCAPAPGNTYVHCNETTPFVPRSPYAVAKLAAHNMARLYREAYKMFVSCGILFNHESEFRGPEFVTRKITLHIGSRLDRARWGGSKYGPEVPTLRLGNVAARRDWGCAPDYVRGMWMMLQAAKADDFVLATGMTRSVAEFLVAAHAVAGLEPRYVIDPLLYRPEEVHVLLGDASKAKRVLGWEPTVTFEEMVERMVRADAPAGTLPVPASPSRRRGGRVVRAPSPAVRRRSRPRSP